MSGNKAFFVTVDSIFALMLATFLFTLIGSQINSMKFDAWRDNHLQRYSMDLLTVMEKSGQFESSAIRWDDTELRSSITQTSKAMCFLLKVNSTNNLVFSIQKEDCDPTGKRRVVTRRTFVAVGDYIEVYTAELHAWYKEV
jgi:hypothetical protein